MKRFLIILMLLLATFGVAFSRTSSKRKRSTAMSGVTVRGNLLRFSPAWHAEKEADGITYLFRKKVKVLVVSCKCSAEGSRSGCVLSRSDDQTMKCESDGCGGTCSVVTDIIKVPAPKKTEPALP